MEGFLAMQVSSLILGMSPETASDGFHNFMTLGRHPNNKEVISHCLFLCKFPLLHPGLSSKIFLK